MPKNLVTVICLSLILPLLAACNREEQAHVVHLHKGSYAGKPMTKLDDDQVAKLQQRAAYGQY
ncbi:MAG TPA: hypothetical protein VF502_09240 [Stellaceae bacterium]